MDVVHFVRLGFPLFLLILSVCIAPFEVRGQPVSMTSPPYSFEEWFIVGSHGYQETYSESILSTPPTKSDDMLVTSSHDTLYWNHHTSPTQIIDLRRVLTETQQAYAFTSFELDSRQRSYFRFGSTGPFKVWINGRIVLEKKDKNDYVLNEHTFHADLKKGPNSILVFLEGWQGEWNFNLSRINENNHIVHGHVLDASGKNAVDTEVELFCSNNITIRTKTNYLGKYSSDLSPKAQECFVKATFEHTGAIQAIPASYNPAFQELNLRLGPTSEISGQSLMMDAQTPLSGAFIEAIRKEDNLVVSSAFSNEIGSFALTTLLPGEYILRVSAPWGYEYFEGGVPGSTIQDPLIISPNTPTISNIKIELPDIRKGTLSRLGPNDGLPHFDLEDLIVDSHGRLVCATSGGGICIYNGHSFEGYTHRDGLTSNYVDYLTESSDGTLWLGTVNGLARLRDSQIEYIELPYANRDKDVTALFADSKGDIWFGAGIDLYHIREGTVTRLEDIENVLPALKLASITEDQAGRIWIGTYGGVGYFEGNVFTVLDPLIGHAILGMYPAKDGSIWLATQNGVFQVTDDEVKHWTTQNGLVHDWTNDICESEDGLIWIATNNGISSFNGQQFINYSTSTGHSNDEVSAINCDFSNMIWAATGNGLVRLDYAIQSFSRSEGLIRTDSPFLPGVFDVEMIGNGQFLIATEWGSAFLFDGFQYTPVHGMRKGTYARKILKTAPDTYLLATHQGVLSLNPHSPTAPDTLLLEEEWTLALAQDKEGSLWIGKGWFNKGLTKYDLKSGNQPEVFHAADSLLATNIWAIYPTNGEKLWLGSNSGILTFESGRFHSVHKEFGLPPSSIFDIMQDKEGHMWFAGSYGVFRYADNRWTHFASEGIFSLSEGEWQLVRDDLKLPEDIVWSIHQSPDGLIWFGTQSRSLVAYDGIAYSHFDNRDGRIGNQIMDIFSDSLGNLWAASLNIGLTKIERRRLPGKVKILSIGSGTENFSIQDPLPSFSIDRTLTLNYEEIDLTSRTEIGQFLITIKDNEENNLDQFVTHNRSFNWLPEKAGDYQVHVQYIDQHLNYSLPEVATLRIHLPLSQNPFFFIPVSLSLIGLMVYTLRLTSQYRNQKKAARVFEKKMLEKETEAKNQLLRINEELVEMNQKLEGRTDSLRVALEQNKEIVGIASHDLKNPLGGIIGLTEMILEDMEQDVQTGYQSAAEHVPLLKGEAERMLKIVTELLDRQRNEEELALQKENVILGDIIPTVLRWNSPQAKDKHIELHYSTKSTIIVEADEVAIQRVLDNYVSNAIKYSPRGSHVWVNVETLPCDTESSIPSLVKVSVRDEGPGLTHEDKIKVFGKMQRLSAKPTGGEHSTGLGLYIVKSLVEAHGGKVGVESEAGQGATFWFTLPTGSFCLEHDAKDQLPLTITMPVAYS